MIGAGPVKPKRVENLMLSIKAANTSKKRLTTTKQSTQPSNLPVLTYQEQPVVTTETLALGYGPRVTNIRTNLDSNRQHFIEGIHLYTVSGHELADLRVNNPDEKLSDITQLLTLRAEKGSVDRP